MPENLSNRFYMTDNLSDHIFQAKIERDRACENVSRARKAMTLACDTYALAIDSWALAYKKLLELQIEEIKFQGGKTS